MAEFVSIMDAENIRKKTSPLEGLHIR